MNKDNLKNDRLKQKVLRANERMEKSEEGKRRKNYTRDHTAQNVKGENEGVYRKGVTVKVYVIDDSSVNKKKRYKLGSEKEI